MNAPIATAARMMDCERRSRAEQFSSATDNASVNRSRSSRRSRGSRVTSFIQIVVATFSFEFCLVRILRECFVLVSSRQTITLHGKLDSTFPSITFHTPVAALLHTAVDRLSARRRHHQRFARTNQRTISAGANDARPVCPVRCIATNASPLCNRRGKLLFVLSDMPRVGDARP